MDTKDKSPNYFVRTLIVGLSLFISWMIGYNFISVDPIGEIGTGLISLLAFLMVIILSEAFDNFSVGKVISLNRENSKKEKDVSSLKSENSELRKQIINIATTVNQNQSSTNIFGMPDDLMQKLYVASASEDEVQEKQSSEDNQEIEEKSVRRRLSRDKLEDLSLNKFIDDNNYGLASLIRDAKLVTQFHGIDAITNEQPIYDGYLRDEGKEIFIEVRPSSMSTILWRERLYMMINKIFLYNKSS